MTSCAELPPRREIDLLPAFAAAERIPPAGVFELDRPSLHLEPEDDELQVRHSGRYVIRLDLPAKTDPATIELRLKLRLGGKPPPPEMVNLTLTDLDGTQLPLPLDQSRRQRGELRTSFAPTAPQHLQLLLDVDLGATTDTTDDTSAAAGGQLAPMPLVIQRPRLLLPPLRPVE